MRDPPKDCRAKNTEHSRANNCSTEEAQQAKGNGEDAGFRERIPGLAAQEMSPKV